MDGLRDNEAALQEAWEEAGVCRADISAEPIGSYDYDKLMRNGDIAPVEAQVYVARVDALSDAYPECDQRERAWFDPAEAARRVAEPQLRDILDRLVTDGGEMLSQSLKGIGGKRFRQIAR